MGWALGMDHLDAADQLGPVAAGPNCYQLARAEVHGARLVQMLKVAMAWYPAPFGPLALLLMTVIWKASKTLLVLASLYLATLGPLGQGRPRCHGALDRRWRYNLLGGAGPEAQGAAGLHQCPRDVPEPLRAGQLLPAQGASAHWLSSPASMAA